MNTLSSMLSFLLGRTKQDYLKAQLRDIFYPVGSYLFTDDAEYNPATSIGGTWERACQGRFIVGAGTNGAEGDELLTITNKATGGEAKHKLTGAESGVKAHSHALSSNGYALMGIESKTASLYGDESSALGGSGKKFPYVDDSVSLYRAFKSADATASSAANSHNNLPPYIGLIVWRRKG